MEAPKTTETAAPTPEQLLKLINLELGRERQKRLAPRRNRASFLAIGIVFIVVGAGIALLFAEQMLKDLRQQGQAPSPAAEMDEPR